MASVEKAFSRPLDAGSFQQQICTILVSNYFTTFAQTGATGKQINEIGFPVENYIKFISVFKLSGKH